MTTVHHAVRTSPFGSALRRVRLPVSLFKRASSSPRLVSPTTMASADFCTGFPAQISPGKSTLLPCTAAAFTSTGIPDAFGVLCHLDAPRRRCQHRSARWLSPLSLRLYAVLVHRLAGFS